MLTGSIVALATPFNNDDIDADALKRLLDFHIENGTDGVLLGGCTGESFTLRNGERNKLFTIAKAHAGNQIPLIVGTGASSTEVALKLSKDANDLGADYALVISPPGNKPTQSAMFDYFTEIANVAPPVILYSVPGRTGGTGILPETAIRLSENDNIVAIKEASGDLDRVSEILKHKPDFCVLSGDDSLTLPMLAIGAQGVISTVANIMPRHMSAMIEAFKRGELGEARQLHSEMLPVIKMLFIEGNPVPLKEAMNLMGLMVGETRPPLGTISDEKRETLIDTLIDAGLMK
jgi:4-hydroxy-tetrahydrodipicolinate synthase